MKTFNPFTNSNHTFASEGLIEEARELGCPESGVINLAFTDYGGTILDKLLLQYLEELAEQGEIERTFVSEQTSWFGKNALIWGNLAREIEEECEGYPLGFRDFEEFFSNAEHEARVEEIERLVKEENFDEEKFEELYEWLIDYSSLGTQGIDYSWHSMREKFEECFLEEE